MNIKKILFYLPILLLLSNCQKETANKIGAVVTGHPEATKIGIKVLEKGGNAIDASIAFPPFSSTLMPILVASGWPVTTAPILLAVSFWQLLNNNNIGK